MDDGSVLFHYVDTIAVFEVAEANPLRRSEGKHHCLARAPAAFQPLGLRRDRLACERRRYVSLERTGVQRPHAVAVGRRADPETQIRAVGPVVEVVRALVSGPREVADLVLPIAFALQRLDRDRVELGLARVVEEGAGLAPRATPRRACPLRR